MESGKKFVTIAGVIACVFGLFLMETPVLGVVLMIAGIALIIFTSRITYEFYQDNRVAFIIAAVIFFFFSPISGILLFIAIDRFNNTSINGPPEEKKLSMKEDKVSKEVKKIDLLLKLGVLMVSISGLLFATTQWDIITGVMKCVVLFIIAIVFLLLYKYTREKLKLVKSANSYYVLAIMFFILTFIAMVYFEVLGKWFSYWGEGSDLAYSLTFGIMGCLTYLAVHKIKLRKTIYVAYTSLYLSLFYILKFCFVDGAIICLILELISFAILLILKQEEKHPLYKFNKFLSFLYFGLIIATENGYLTAPCGIIGIGLLLYLLGVNKDKISSILIPLLINIIVMTIAIALPDSVNCYVYIILANIVYWSMLSVKGKDKSITIANDLIYSLSMTFFMFWSGEDSMYVVFVNAALFFVTTFALSTNIFKVERSGIPKYVTIISILCFISSFFGILGDVISFDRSVIAIFLLLAYCLAHAVITDKPLKTTYLVFICILSYFYLLASTEDELLPAIGSVIGLTYLFRYGKGLEALGKKAIFSNINFVLLLVGLFNVFVTCNLLGMARYFNILVIVWIYLIILYVSKNTTRKKLLLLALCLPLYSFVESISMLISNDMIMILNNILLFYIIFVIVKYFILNKNKINLIVCILVIIGLLDIVFNRSLVIALYVGILALVIMFIGYYKEEVKTLFKVGLVTIIFNIFYQLYDVLKMIPFWIYLLVVGLGLIAFVTIKETKKLPTENEEKK